MDAGPNGVRFSLFNILVNLQSPTRFYQSKPIGPRMEIRLQPGDIYIMSEKAVGHDWKLRKVPTLRHAAGDFDFLLTKIDAKKRKLHIDRDCVFLQ